MITALPCSAQSLGTGEPMAGSSPVASAWIAIEQLGPFGSDAIVNSHFPAEIGAQIASRCKDRAIRPVLIRRPGQHSDDHRSGHARHVWLAYSVPGEVKMARLVITDPESLLGLDYDALAAGRLAATSPMSVADEDPLLLVCTHAKRDVCCARLGRPISNQLATDDKFEGRVWETSHLGGHRFAATALQLPHGWTHGRLDLAAARNVLLEARLGRVSLESARGRSSLSSQAQVADLAVRRHLGITGLDATSVRAADAEGNYLVAVDGLKTRSVWLTEAPGPARAQSCGESPAPWVGFAADIR